MSFYRGTSPVICFFLLSVLLFSCTRADEPHADPCMNVICRNGHFDAVNSQCVCVCTPGYKGLTCDTLRDTGFLGRYTCNNQRCNSGFSSIFISVDSNSYNRADVNISGLHHANANTIANLDSGDRSFTIPAQPLAGSTISGSATLHGDSLIITYVVQTGSSFDTCFGVFVHQ